MNFLRRLFRKSAPELVRYYDAATRTTVLIPKAELGPGVVLVQVEGDSEPMYADATDLKLGSVRHSTLNEELRAHIALLSVELADVYPKLNAEWEDGFCRDRNPEHELAGWLHLAAILKVMTQREGYDVAHRKECFRILIACFTGARDTVKERSDPQLLPKPDIEQVIKYFYEGGYE